MNWDIAGIVAEIIGAAAVVISVAYLAIQIKAQTEQSKLGATRDLATQYANNLGLLIEDGELAEIYLRGCRDYNDLPNTERLRVAGVFQRRMKLVEQQHLHVSKGNIDPAFFESMDKTYFEWLTFPGVQQWWELNHDYFSSEFRASVEAQVILAKEKGYASTLKTEAESST